MAQKEKSGANKKDKKSRRGKKRQERSKRQDSNLCLSNTFKGRTCHNADRKRHLAPGGDITVPAAEPATAAAV